VSVTFKDDLYHMHYYGGQVGGGVGYMHYAYSSDGVTFTQPNIGRVTYDSNTNNNIVMDGVFVSARWEPTISKWVYVFEAPSAADNPSQPGGLYVYTSSTPDGAPTLVANPSHTGYHEGKDIIRRPDGHWLAYHVQGHGAQFRSITAWESTTTDLETTGWTKYELAIPAISSAVQRYIIAVHRVGDVYVAFMTNFDQTGVGVLSVDLWASRTGLRDWVRVGRDVLPIGGVGQWDAVDVRATRIAENGDEWSVYYNGAPNGHETANVLIDRAIGRATTGRGRLVGWTGTGTLRTVPVVATVGVGESIGLTINADASAGSLVMELRDGNGAVIPGFGAASFDTITADVYDFEPTWNGAPMPTGGAVAIVFSLTNASLHGYTIARS
jgi:hypothetical protein